MQEILIVGGGLSGLTAAYYLSKNGKNVRLLEASPKLGGRTYSLKFKDENLLIDNGQHILVGAYEFTLSLLKSLGTFSNLKIPSNLYIPFLERGGRHHFLSGLNIFHPFDKLSALLKFSALSIEDRAKLINFFLKIFITNQKDLEGISVSEWLSNNNQNEKLIKNFWDILIVGIMNSNASNVDASLFCSVLKKLFFNKRNSANIIIPQPNFNELIISPVINFVKEKGGNIHTGKNVVAIEPNEVFTSQKEKFTFSKLILAIPHKNLMNIKGISDKLKSFEFQYSPIFNAHLTLYENPFKEQMYGFLDSELNWIFNHKKYISITTSNPSEIKSFNKEKLFNFYMSETEDFYPLFTRKIVKNSIIIKEKFATFIPSSATNIYRNNLNSFIDNKIFLAGDWTNNQLPATIEGAIKSGYIVSEKILNTD